MKLYQTFASRLSSCLDQKISAYVAFNSFYKRAWSRHLLQPRSYWTEPSTCSPLYLSSHPSNYICSQQPSSTCLTASPIIVNNFLPPVLASVLFTSPCGGMHTEDPIEPESGTHDYLWLSPESSASTPISI